MICEFVLDYEPEPYASEANKSQLTDPYMLQ